MVFETELHLCQLPFCENKNDVEKNDGKKVKFTNLYSRQTSVELVHLKTWKLEINGSWAYCSLRLKIKLKLNSKCFNY
jgi:hypothetical protein